MPSLCTMAEPEDRLQRMLQELNQKHVPSSKESLEYAKVAIKTAQLASEHAKRREQEHRIAEITAQRAKQRLDSSEHELRSITAEKEAGDIHRSMAADNAAGDDLSVHASKPPTTLAVIHPVPPVQQPPFEELKPVQQLTTAANQLPGATSDAATPAAVFSHLLHQPGALAGCTDEATARAVFHTACCGQDADVAAAAYSTFLGWCGVTQLAAGDEVLQLDYSLPWTPAPPTALCWVPGAADFLAALQALGCSSNSSSGAGASTAAAAAGSSKQAPRGSARSSSKAAAADAAANGTPQKQQQQEGAELAYRDAPLRQPLSLLAHLCRLTATGKVDAPLPEGPVKQLGVLLLQLQLDPRVQVAALAAAQEALEALVEALDDVTWCRVGGELAAALAAPLGPSHRAAVVVLQQLPGGPLHPRLQQLKQAGSWQLLRMLLKHPRDKQRTRSLSVPPNELLQLLKQPAPNAAAGSKASGGGSSSRSQPQEGAVRQLVDLLREGGSRSLDFWALQSVLDAADVMLWTAAEAGVLQLDAQLVPWWNDYLKSMDHVVSKQYPVQSQYLRARISELLNVYASFEDVEAAAEAAEAEAEGMQQET